MGYLCGRMDLFTNTPAQRDKNNRQIAAWLIIGAAMILVQIVLGGITRLTYSGLSITEWKPVTGVLPPMGDAAWQAEFDKYKATDQFKYINQHFTLSDFKQIFFWEWFHRLWARLMGVVFLIGFFYFIIKKKFTKDFVLPMVILFILGGIQGFIGWFMVKSGLVPEKYFVGHVELATHFTAALILMVYVLWFAYSILPSFRTNYTPAGHRTIMALSVLFFFQIVYGAFMAGMHAGQVAPTFPDINGKFIPDLWNDELGFANFTHNPLMVQFVHRGLAYLITLLTLIFYFRSRSNSALFNRLRNVYLLLVIVQVLLGIFTLLNSTEQSKLLYWGIAHQFNAIMILGVLTALFYLGKKPKAATV